MTTHPPVPVLPLDARELEELARLQERVAYWKDTEEEAEARTALHAYLTDERIAGLVAAAQRGEAWREYAEHQEWCRYCGEDGVEQCDKGRPLRDAARAASPMPRGCLKALPDAWTSGLGDCQCVDCIAAASPIPETPDAR